MDPAILQLVVLLTGILTGGFFGFILHKSATDKKRKNRVWLHVYSTGSMGYKAMPIKRGTESVELEIEGRTARVTLDGTCRFNDKETGEIVFPVNAKTGKVFRPPEGESETGLDLDGYKLAVLLEGADIKSMSGGLGDLRALAKYALVGLVIIGIVMIGGFALLGTA